MGDVGSQTKRVLDEKPEYKAILRRIVAWEDLHPRPDSPFLEYDSFETWWEYDDVTVDPARCQYLVRRGIVTEIFDFRSYTGYALTDRDAVRTVIGPKFVTKFKRRA